jgi:hypothetical protein
MELSWNRSLLACARNERCSTAQQACPHAGSSTVRRLASPAQLTCSPTAWSRFSGGSAALSISPATLACGEQSRHAREWIQFDEAARIIKIGARQHRRVLSQRKNRGGRPRVALPLLLRRPPL